MDNHVLLFSRNSILIGGLIAYFVLLAATYILLKRQVTTELFLIVGWMVLAFLELNALYALGQYSKNMTIVFLIITAIVAVISLVCYLLYYNLDHVKGYIDGMIPLILITMMMVAITFGVTTT